MKIDIINIIGISALILAIICLVLDIEISQYATAIWIIVALIEHNY